MTVEEEADPDTIGDSANTTETQVSSESESRTPPVHGNSEKMVEFGKPRTKDHTLLDDLNLALNQARASAQVKTGWGKLVGPFWVEAS